MRVLYTIAGLITLANGAWMLAAPRAWYLGLPAAVPDTGPFNAHFVRDLGVVYVVMSLGLAWCAPHLDRCRPVHIGLTLLPRFCSPSSPRPRCGGGSSPRRPASPPARRRSGNRT